MDPIIVKYSKYIVKWLYIIHNVKYILSPGTFTYIFYGRLLFLHFQKKRPIRWLSPEAIKLNHIRESDIWSLGVLLWEITNHGNKIFQKQNM